MWPSGPAAGRLGRGLAVVALSLAYVAYVFRRADGTFFTVGLGDWMDPYFINALLENWYRSLTHFAAPAPPWFFPSNRVLGYSHSLVLFAPFYVPGEAGAPSDCRLQRGDLCGAGGGFGRPVCADPARHGRDVRRGVARHRVLRDLHQCRQRRDRRLDAARVGVSDSVDPARRGPRCGDGRRLAAQRRRCARRSARLARLHPRFLHGLPGVSGGGTGRTRRVLEQEAEPGGDCS